MHIRDLGISARYLGTVLRRLLDSHFWTGDTAEEELASMVTDIKIFYKLQGKALERPQGLSRTGDSWSKLLGKRKSPVFKGVGYFLACSHLCNVGC